MCTTHLCQTSMPTGMHCTCACCSEHTQLGMIRSHCEPSWPAHCQRILCSQCHRMCRSPMSIECTRCCACSQPCTQCHSSCMPCRSSSESGPDIGLLRSPHNNSKQHTSWWGCHSSLHRICLLCRHRSYPDWTRPEPSQSHSLYRLLKSSQSHPYASQDCSLGSWSCPESLQFDQLGSLYRLLQLNDCTCLWGNLYKPTQHHHSLHSPCLQHSSGTRTFLSRLGSNHQGRCGILWQWSPPRRDTCPPRKLCMQMSLPTS